MNRNNWLLLGLVLMMAVGLALMPTAGAASGIDPGTAEDPLVAKSYLDQLVRLQVLELEAGAVLRGEAGTEMVLRPAGLPLIRLREVYRISLPAGTFMKLYQLTIYY